MSVYPLLYVSTGAAMMTANFIGSPKFHIFLQQWHSYFKTYSQVFRNCENNRKKHLSSSVLDFSRIDHMSKRLVRLCLAIYMVFIPWEFFLLRKCLLKINSNCDRSDIEQAWIYEFLGPFCMLYISLDQSRLVIMMQAIVEAFRQLGSAVKSYQSNLDFEEIMVFHKISNSPNPEQIIRLVYHIRKLISLLRCAVGPSQVIFLGFFFSGTIITWMMILYFIKGEMPLFLVVTIMQIWLLQIFVFINSTKIVEKMLKEENEVLTLISKLNISSLRMKIEVIALRTLFVIIWNI